jgi:hypothetical protein
MVDAELEQTLNEIRTRARAEAHARATSQPHAAGGELAAPNAHDAESMDAREPAALPAANRDDGADALARLDANLATAERAWNRLPPLMSNRAGLAARVELWLKRQIKRATHWFTWEQVNFNSAAYHALRDTRAAVEACRRALFDLGEETRAETRAAATAGAERRREDVARAEQRREDVARAEAALTALNARLAETDARLREAELGLAASRDELRAANAAHDGLRAELAARDESQKKLLEALRGEVSAELRERVEHVAEEQRVSLRQLSLEAGERAVLHDRARRDLETKLEEIRKAVVRD